MKIKFQDPLNGKPFNIVNNNPFFNSSPKNGVYIYGLLKNINANDQFIPLNVGETKGEFEKRLIKDHYSQLISGCSTKEIFDFKKVNLLQDVIEIYDAIQQYDNLAGKSILKTKLPYISKSKLIQKYLLYFQNLEYFNIILKRSDFSGSYNVLLALEILLSKNEIINSDRIKEMLSIYKSNFYFIYTEILDPNQLKSVELLVKMKLKDLNIHTSAIANSKEIIENYNIDLSCIQDNLINLTGAPFKNPLIL